MEPQLWSVSHSEPTSQLTSEKAASALESLHSLLKGVWVATKPIHIYVCELIICANADAGDGQACQSGIFDSSANNVAELALDQRGNPLLASDGQCQFTLSFLYPWMTSPF